MLSYVEHHVVHDIHLLDQLVFLQSVQVVVEVVVVELVLDLLVPETALTFNKKLIVSVLPFLINILLIEVVRLLRNEGRFQFIFS